MLIRMQLEQPTSLNLVEEQTAELNEKLNEGRELIIKLPTGAVLRA